MIKIPHKKGVWLIAISLCLALCAPVLSSGQFVVTPASSDCSCDGGLSYSVGQPVNAYFAWYDNDGNLLLEEVSADGQSGLSGICPGVYWLETNTGNGVELAFTNVPGTANPGNASSDTLCSTEGNFDLTVLLPGYQPGGTWTDATGQVVGNVHNTA
ncbi:MAG: hypothetical protein RL220_539, partial [Bacteroidota bacterium]